MISVKTSNSSPLRYPLGPSVEIGRGLPSLRDSAPRADWSMMSPSDHFVQFYDSEMFLLSSICGFIGTGLRMGETGIVVATSEHRQELISLLRDQGLDIEVIQASGQLVLLDAAETMQRLLIDGMPDPVAFAEIVGKLIEDAAGRGGNLRIFGEVVALLWQEGRHKAAIRLEELWNDMGKKHQFALFCAYPMNGFGGDDMGNPLLDVCSTHSHVIPAESYCALDDHDDRMRAITGLQQKAQSLEAEIAERKKAEAALRVVQVELELMLDRERSARAEAESANRLKDEFLATVSHELRTPLTAIFGWLHLLRTGPFDEELMSEGLETIERNTEEQARLVEDILDISRIITGELYLSITPVDIAAIVSSAVDAIRPAAESKQITLAVDIEPSISTIRGDKARMRQILWNLLSNAVSFTPNGGRVDITVDRAGAGIRLGVCDTGEGIDPEFLPYIFDRFRQADGSISRKHGGLGLGLAIVRHLTELHGGTVHAASPGSGMGATFTVEIPEGVGC